MLAAMKTRSPAFSSFHLIRIFVGDPMNHGRGQTHTPETGLYQREPVGCVSSPGQVFRQGFFKQATQIRAVRMGSLFGSRQETFFHDGPDLVFI
jgi:hypothetical protein